MMPKLTRLVLPIGALALAGCDARDNDPGPGGVTMGEARALDEAAQMIDARRPPPGLVPAAPSPVADASEAVGTDAP